MNQFGQALKQPSSFGHEQRRDLPAVRIIPYDYVAEFPLSGNPGTLIQDVINISVEGIFVAVSIGYGLDDERTEPLTLRGSGMVKVHYESCDETLKEESCPKPNNKISMDESCAESKSKWRFRELTLGELTLDHISPDLLIEGFRIDPQYANLALKNGRLNTDLPFSVLQGPTMTDPAKKGIFQKLRRTENFGFLLSLVDTATGRELQNEPVHNVATLGRADGRRPFKMLPQPMVFMPRSTIRLQVEERTTGVTGRLVITLQGYKVLGVAGKLEDQVRILGDFDPLKQIPAYNHETGNYRPLGEAIKKDIPTTKIVPFDYVSTLDLTGKPGNLVEDEIPVNIDGGYLTTAIGYSLDGPDTRIQIEPSLNEIQVDADDYMDLRKIKLTDIKPAEALLDGIRIDPHRLRFAFTSGGRLSTVPREMVDRIFQRVNQSDNVRFLYAIADSGTGRDLQNQPVYSVAGLGIADGDRPFRVLHKPMTFLPRSTIRVQIEEIFGRGRLFIVFQGYKILR